MHKKDHAPWSTWNHSRVTRMAQHTQINQYDTITSTTTKKDKKHMIISIDEKKAFGKIQIHS